MAINQSSHHCTPLAQVMQKSQSYPLARHRPESEDLTWLCACGKVEFSCKKLNTVALCFCDDCCIRVRIGQSLNKHDARFNNFWTSNGGWAQASAFEKDLTFIKGEEQLRGFRCSVGQKSKSVTAYTNCCGMICYQLMERHPGILNINNLHRLRGWRSPEQQDSGYKQTDFLVPIGYQCAKWTGAKMPDGSRPIKLAGKAGMSYGCGNYPSGLQQFLNVTCPMFCADAKALSSFCCCFGRCWAHADCCCLRRGLKTAALEQPPVFDLLANSIKKMVFVSSTGHHRSIFWLCFKLVVHVFLFVANLLLSSSYDCFLSCLSCFFLLLFPSTRTDMS